MMARVLLVRVLLVVLLPLLVAENVYCEVRRAWRNMHIVRAIRDDMSKWRSYWRADDQQPKPRHHLVQTDGAQP